MSDDASRGNVIGGGSGAVLQVSSAAFGWVSIMFLISGKHLGLLSFVQNGLLSGSASSGTVPCVYIRIEAVVKMLIESF